MADKIAYFINPETLEHTYDQVFVSADENGKYKLPENATWVCPIKEDGSGFFLARWNPTAQAWEEGGTIPEPSPPAVVWEGISKEQYLTLLKENIDVKKKLATMQLTVNKLVLAQAQATKTQ